MAADGPEADIPDCSSCKKLCSLFLMFSSAFWTDVPGVTVLLVLAGLLLAAGIGFVLGPSGRPTAPGRRSGGFSRALAARADQHGEL